MINHVRTLLLNETSPESQRWDVFGEEFVPPGFKPRSLPTPLTGLYRSLFGANPDRVFKNWRLRQYLRLLHTPKWEPHVLYRDRRVTYLPIKPLPQLTDRIQKVVEYGSLENLQILTPTVFHDSQGYWEYRIEVLSPTSIRVTEFRRESGPNVFYPQFSVSNSLTSPITIPEISLQFCARIDQNSSWRLRVLAEPRKTLYQTYLEVCQLVEGEAAQLLFSDTSQKDVAACDFWWKKSAYPWDKLCAVVLSLALYMDRRG